MEVIAIVVGGVAVAVMSLIGAGIYICRVSWNVYCDIAKSDKRYPYERIDLSKLQNLIMSYKNWRIYENIENCLFGGGEEEDIFCIHTSHIRVNGVNYILSYKDYKKFNEWVGYFYNFIKVNHIKIEEVEHRFNDSLKNICTLFGIELHYVDSLGDAAGIISYNKNETSVIKILKEHYTSPWVLAHELGHYIALEKYNDESESGAGKQGSYLCRSILNEKEASMLDYLINIYLYKEVQKDEENK